MDFLRDKALEILNSHSDHLHEIIVVVPSMRAIMFFAQHMSGRAHVATIAPDVMTMDQFMCRMAGGEVTDHSKLLITLLNVARQRVPERCTSLSEFMSWGPLLLNDFNAIDEHLISPSHILNNTARARILEQWHPDSIPQKGPLEKKFEKFYDALYDIYTDFIRALNEFNYYTRGLIYRIASEKAEKNQSFFAKKVYFLGFNALTGSEEYLVRKLIEAGKAELIGDFDEYYTTIYPFHEAGTFFRKLNKSNLLSDKTVLTKSLSEDPKFIVNHSVTGKIEQTYVLAHIIKSLQSGGYSDFNNVAVVLPDDSMLFPLLNHLPKIDSGINVTMQLPLDKLPVFQWIVSYIKALEFASRKDNSYFFYYLHIREIFGNALSNRFFDFHKINDLLQHISRNNLIFLTEEMIRDKAGITEENLFKIVSSPAELFSSARSLVELGIKRSDALTLFESEQLYMIREVLNEIEDQAVSWPSDFFTLREIPFFLEGIASSYGISLKGEPVQGLQVMGMLETRLLNFDVVIVLSSNEDLFPKNNEYHSIIPYDIAREYGLPEFRHHQAVISYHFFQLLRNSNEIHLVSYQPAVGTDQQLPSRFIYQCKWELARHNPNITFKEINYSQPLRINRHQGVFALKKDVRFRSSLIRKLTEVGISPTDLANYIERPKDFYTRYLLGIKETEDVVEDLDSRISGTVIHEILKELYSPFLNERFPSKDALLALRERAEYAMDHHLTHKYPQIDWNKGKNYLSKFIANQMVLNQINSDLVRIKNNEKTMADRVIRFLEHRMEMFLPQILDKPVKLYGVIDRVEEQDGIYHIIDYKTGKYDISTKSKYDLSKIDFLDAKSRVHAGKSLQLICYMLMLADNLGEGDYNFMASLNFLRYKGNIEQYLYDSENAKNTARKDDLKLFNSANLNVFRNWVIDLIREMLDIEMHPYLNELSDIQ